MKKLFGFLFTRHFFAERILFLAIAGGMLLDGWVSAVFHTWSTESLLRIGLSLFAGCSFLFSYSKNAGRIAIRVLAYLSISSLLLFSAYLSVIHHFNYDEALTMLGAYLICSLYFRSFNELLLYLFLGLLIQIVAIQLATNPLIDPHLFVLRNFLGALLVLGLSYATRQFQEQLHQFSRKVAEENRSLNETKLALEERLTHEHLLALVASKANTAVIISRADDRIEWVNDGFSMITGYSRDEAVGKLPTLLHGAETDKETIAFIAEQKAKGAPFHAVILNYTKSGNKIWIQMHVTPLADANGKIERFIAIEEDITEIKLNEQELRSSREQLKAAQEQAKIGSWELEEETGMLIMSDEMIRILGLNGVRRIPYTTAFDRIYPEDLEVVKRSIENGLKRKSAFELEFRGVVNGQMKYVYLTAQSYLRPDRTGEILIGTLQDITERKRIEEEMQLAERQYRSLFENSQHMICMHDLDGQVLSINQAGAHAMGYEPEEVIGKNIRHFFFHENENSFPEYMKVISSNGSAEGVLRLKVRHGSSTMWLYNNILLTGPDGNPFVLCSNVDITSRIELEKELRKAKKAAEEALLLKDRFVANISHELRTPMNAIVGFTELLIKTKLSDEQKEYISAVNLAGTNLTSMINDVLDLAKIEAGKIEFDSKPFDLRKVFEDLRLILSQSAAQKGLSFTWHCAEGIPAYLIGDDHRLSQILINLLGNAIKFTDNGYVKLSANLKSENHESLTIEFMVEDSGIGISEQKMNDIFEPFAQASMESSRKYGGTGLGLSIVRDLVVLQGGTVSVESKGGSTFNVILTYKKVGKDFVQQVEEALMPIESPGKINILVIEDQPLNQQLAKRLINDFGFTYEMAVNGKQAISILRDNPHQFDVILMDLQMPEIDGYETTHFLRNELNISTPIIAVTAHTSSGEREKCLALGMNDYLAKPYRAQEFYFKIVSAIRKQVIQIPENATPEESTNPLKALAGGDHKFEREMINMMLRSIPEDLSKLRSFHAADDFDQVAATAHRLKSSAALVGEKKLAEMLEEAEGTKKLNMREPAFIELLDAIIKQASLLLLRLETDLRELE